MTAETWIEAVVELAPALAALEDFPVPRGVDVELCAACSDVECQGSCDLALWIVRQVIEDAMLSHSVTEIVESIEGSKAAERFFR